MYETKAKENEMDVYLSFGVESDKRTACNNERGEGGCDAEKW
jgi:hypothetical protein